MTGICELPSVFNALQVILRNRVGLEMRMNVPVCFPQGLVRHLGIKHPDNTVDNSSFFVREADGIAQIVVLLT